MQDTNFEEMGLPLGLKKQSSEQSWESTMNKRETLFQDRQFTSRESKLFSKLLPKVEVPISRRDNNFLFNNGHYMPLKRSLT